MLIYYFNFDFSYIIFTKLISNNTKVIKIWDRSSVILPLFVGKKFLVYNGIKFISVLIKKEMIGHKFGEFSSTRRVGQLKKKKK